jgi:hypothetical protein
VTGTTTGRVAWCVALLLAIAACSDEDGDGTAEPISAADIAVEAVESRNLSADGNLGVAVTNTGDEPLELSGITLTAPPYPAASTTPRAPLEPGRTVVYAVPKGPPSCETPAGHPDGAAPDEAFIVDLVVGDATVTLPVGRPEVLRRIGDRECGVENVLAVADVTFGAPVPDGTTGAGSSVATTVEVTRRSGTMGTVAVTGVRGTPQFSLAGAVEPPLAVLGPGDGSAVAAVTASALRCDAHVLAEGKKNFTFGVFLSLDDGPDALVEIQAPEDLHAALVDLCDVH